LSASRRRPDRPAPRSALVAVLYSRPQALVAERWLLAEDLPALMERAGQKWDEATGSRPAAVAP